MFGGITPNVNKILAENFLKFYVVIILSPQSRIVEEMKKLKGAKEGTHWCFQGVWNETSSVKLVNLVKIFSKEDSNSPVTSL